ncbi:MAG: class I SAM-dependent methyltransferase [Bacteroidia bacterium]
MVAKSITFGHYEQTNLDMENYIEMNKKSWDNRLESHLSSDFYNLKAFLNGKSSLNSIELDLLGDVRGKSILHLQCHFGQDSISLSRMGAIVTGVDFSEKSIDKARELAIVTQNDTEFICCNLYELPEHLNKKYDIVFTSYGTITWMPDLLKWAAVVKHFLKPKGKFIFVEFHPIVWMFDDDLETIIYNYFNVKPIIEEEQGTYADRSATISNTSTTWNHSISEVVQSIMSMNLTITNLKEYDYAPYPFVKGCEEFEPIKFRIKKFENKLPLVYSIVAN